MREKIEFKNPKEKKLVGVLHLPEKENKKVIVICHGFCANKDRKRLIAIADIYAKNGISALRFDFSGSGESENDEITVENQVDDLKSAIEFVKERGYKDIGIQGESLGGLVSLLVYNEDVKAIVLWAPVTAGKDKLEEVVVQEKLSKEELEEKGYVIKKKDGRDFKIPKKYFEERLKINQKKLLSRVKCSVLILHGDKDDVVPLEESKEALQYLRDAKLEVIKGGSHKLDMIQDVFDLSLNWFKKYL